MNSVKVMKALAIRPKWVSPPCDLLMFQSMCFRLSGLVLDLYLTNQLAK